MLKNGIRRSQWIPCLSCLSSDPCTDWYPVAPVIPSPKGLRFYTHSNKKISSGQKIGDFQLSFSPLCFYVQSKLNQMPCAVDYKTSNTICTGRFSANWRKETCKCCVSTVTHYIVCKLVCFKLWHIVKLHPWESSLSSACHCSASCGTGEQFMSKFQSRRCHFLRLTFRAVQ